MTKTIHPLLAQYSSTKWSKVMGGAYSRGGAKYYFKFCLIGGALIRRGAYSRGALIRGFMVSKNLLK